MRVVLILFLSSFLWSHEDSKNGFEISSKAMESLGIEFQNLEKSGKSNEVALPASALVHSKDRFGIYIKHSNKISLIFVNVIRETSNSVMVSTDDLKGMDEVAVKGVGFLRMIEESGHNVEHSH